MQDADNLNGVVELAEADSVVAKTQAKFRRFDVLQTANVALFGQGEACQAMQQAQRCPAINRADISLSSPWQK